nr:hypothetical protein ICEMyc226_00025 [Mycolicibacterium sp.]
MLAGQTIIIVGVVLLIVMGIRARLRISASDRYMRKAFLTWVPLSALIGRVEPDAAIPVGHSWVSGAAHGSRSNSPNAARIHRGVSQMSVVIRRDS